MPTYEYECTACKHRFERVQRFSDAPITECPLCGSPVRRVLFPAGIVFKGSGWYKTDSRPSPPSESSSAPTSPSASASASGSTASASKSESSSKSEATNGKKSESSSKSEAAAGKSDSAPKTEAGTSKT